MARLSESTKEGIFMMAFITGLIVGGMVLGSWYSCGFRW